MTSWSWRRSSSRRAADGAGGAGRAAISPIADCSVAVQQEFRIGFAPDDRSALRTRLAAKDVTVEQMAEAGLVITGDDIPVAYDRFRDRVMFPIRDGRGRVIAFGGRALSKEALAKYLNSPETPLFHKGRVLYNLDKARGPAHEAGEIIAVEGYMDAIAMHRAGLAYVVAPLGTALTADQLGLLWRIAPEPTLCFDGDEAGHQGRLSRPRSGLAAAQARPFAQIRAAAGRARTRTISSRAKGLMPSKRWSPRRGRLPICYGTAKPSKARIDTPDGRASFEVRLSSARARDRR